MNNMVPDETIIQDNLQQPETPTGKSPHPGYRKLLERLYLLAELKAGKTLSDKSLTIIDHTTFTSWYRWWYDEGRVKSMNLVYTIVDEAKNYLETSTEAFEEKKVVLSALLCAKSGIETLLETYSDDPQIKARTNAISAEIQAMVRQHQPQISPLWPRFVPTLGALSGITQHTAPINYNKKGTEEVLVGTHVNHPTSSSSKISEIQENLNID